MIPRADIDTREFNRAIRQLSGGVKGKAAALSNQIAMDVVREWFNWLPPKVSTIRAKRKEIKNYLTQVLISKRIKVYRFYAAKVKRKLDKSSLKPGETFDPERNVAVRTVIRKRTKYRRTDKKDLQTRHLILQSSRRKEGLRGLYGKEMARFAGAFSRRAQISVGYLKVVMLPIIRTLNRVAKYPMPWSETGGNAGGRISIWPGSKGHGIAIKALGKNPVATLDMAWNLKGPRESYARSLIFLGWRHAVDFKLGKLRRQIELGINPDLRKVNPSKARIVKATVS